MDEREEVEKRLMECVIQARKVGISLSRCLGIVLESEDKEPIKEQPDEIIS